MDNSAKKTKQKGLTFKDVDPFFVPYACHISPDTIITKNGNLLQTIKITGFNYEIVGNEKIDLRSAIRKAINQHIPNDTYAIWLHTFRRKKDLSLHAEFPNKFCDGLNLGWNEIHDWSNQYVNELYLTILTENNSYKLSNIKTSLKALSFAALKASEKIYINKKHQELNEISAKILEELNIFGAKKLGLYQDKEGIYYSELMRFLGKIINLEEKEMPLDDMDLSYSLPYCQMVFGKNIFEVMDKGRKHSACIFSLKEYNDISIKSLDKFLQLPVEFIVTQTLDFINAEEAQADFEQQKIILEISEDEKFAEVSGINKITASHHTNNKTAFGEQQTSLMIIADSKKDLEKAIEQVATIILDFGLVLIREDIFMENTYWSQLPGNFSYICRRKPINTERFAGFGSISNFPAGKRRDNEWGDAITVFHTKNKTPYFFNFHYEHNGHTMLIGPKGTGKTVLLNFLIAQATKVKPEIIYLDFYNSSEIFIKALGGKYHQPDIMQQQSLFNPAPLFKKKPKYLQKFLALLTLQKTEINDKGYIPDQEKHNFIAQICNKVENGALEFNSLGDLAPEFKGSKYEKFFNLWLKGNKLGHFFDNETSMFDTKGGIYGYDFTKIAKHKVVLVPLLYYLMHEFEENLDEHPTILVIDETFKLFDNPFLAGELHDFLARLKDHNCVAILASESIEDAKKSHITDLLINEVSTEFYLPNKKANKTYRDIFKLSHAEYTMINKISNDERCFLLKHGNDAVTAELDLVALDHIVAILSSDEFTIKIMNKIISETSEDPEDWLEIFQNTITELITKSLEQEVEEQFQLDAVIEASAKKALKNKDQAA